MRYLFSLIAGLIVTVAMLWLIWTLTSYHPKESTLRPAVTRLNVVPALAAPQPAIPQRTQLELPSPPTPPDEPPPEPLPPLPTPTPTVEMPEPTLPEPVLSIDLPGRPLLGAREPPRPRPPRRVTKPAKVSNTVQTSLQPTSTAPATATASTSPVERQLTPVVRTQPTYPRRARMRGQQGAVKLRFTVTPRGAVRDIQVVWARPPGVFDREAKRALARWRFEPAIENGREVSAIVSQVITFKLQR